MITRSSRYFLRSLFALLLIAGGISVLVSTALAYPTESGMPFDRPVSREADASVIFATPVPRKPSNGPNKPVPQSTAAPQSSEAPLGSVSLQIDDGTRENQAHYSDDYAEYAAIWLNRFTPPAESFPITLQSISVYWPSGPNGSITGKSITLVVYHDADGDNNPSNAQYIGQQIVTVGTVEAFQDYSVDMVIPGSGGDVYIGFENTYAREGHAPPLKSASADLTQPQYRSWVVANSDWSPPDLSNLSNNDVIERVESMGGMAANWMIRAGGHSGSGECTNNYTIIQSLPIEIVPGDTDTGNHCDECTTTIGLPFPFRLYDQVFYAADVGSNGTLQFSDLDREPGFQNTCFPTDFNYTILAHWDDLTTYQTGDGIFTSVTGSAPNRIFNIEWRAHLYKGGPVNFEVSLYENSPTSQFDIIFGSLSGSGGGATMGVQQSPDGLFKGGTCDWAVLSEGLRFRFTLDACDTPTVTPTSTSIPDNTSSPTMVAPSTSTPTSTTLPSTPTSPAEPPSQGFVTFNDVQSSDYFYYPVSYLASQNIISGYQDGTFRPSNTTTRAQMIKIVVNAFAIPDYVPPGGGHTFADVDASSVFFSMIEAAKHASIIDGYACGGPGEACDSLHRPYFRPGREVSRGQVCKIIAIADQWNLINPATPTFADVPPTSVFYEYIETAVSKNIIGGYQCGGPGELCDSAHRPYFRSNGNALRGQLAKIVYNALPLPDRAINRLNVYRAIAGLPLLQSHPSIQSATQNHANYFLLNHNDPSAMIYGAHGEVEGKIGFTGRWPSDRISNAGFPWGGGSEIMHFLNEPVGSVDGWMATIYHRVIPLDINAAYTGYGTGSQAEGNGYVSVDVMDFGMGPNPPDVTPYPLAYPVDGQINVPTSWNGAESPDPLPPGAQRPVGYPVTLQGEGGTLDVDFAELRTASGQLVPTHPSPADCASFNCYALIPVRPLQPNSSYIVSARGAVGNVTFNRTWTFTTTVANSGLRPSPHLAPAYRATAKDIP